MTKPKKPEPWRGCLNVRRNGYSVAEEAVFPEGTNCTVYPDGCDLPMDAATKKLVNAAVKWAKEIGFSFIQESHLYKAAMAYDRKHGKKL